MEITNIFKRFIVLKGINLNIYFQVKLLKYLINKIEEHFNLGFMVLGKKWILFLFFYIDSLHLCLHIEREQ